MVIDQNEHILSQQYLRLRLDQMIVYTITQALLVK